MYIPTVAIVFREKCLVVENDNSIFMWDSISNGSMFLNVIQLRFVIYFHFLLKYYISKYTK